MGLVPTPPTYRKPRLNWSLLRRYSLIVPPVRIPTQFQAPEEQEKWKNLCGFDLFRDLAPNVPLPPLPHETKPSAQQETGTLKAPRLLNLQDVTVRQTTSQTQKLRFGFSKPKIPSTSSPIEMVPLLKGEINECRLNGTSLIRVPGTFRPFKPRTTASVMIQKRLALPLLHLPTTELNTVDFRSHYTFRLIKMEQINLTESSFHVNSLKSCVPDNPSPEQRAAMKLLVLRKQAACDYTDSRSHQYGRNYKPHGSASPLTAKQQGTDWVDHLPAVSQIQLLRIPTRDHVIHHRSSVVITPSKSDPTSDCPSTTNDSQRNSRHLENETGRILQADTEEQLVQTNPCPKYDKAVSTLSAKNFGMQFDDILEEDAFIFRNYVIGRDGVRHVRNRDLNNLQEPLANHSVPGRMEEVRVPLANLKDIFANQLKDNQNEFLSVCSIELSELDTAEPNQSQTEVSGPVKLPEILCIGDGVDQPSQKEPVQRHPKTDSETQYEPVQASVYEADDAVKENICLPHDQKPCNMSVDERAYSIRLDVVKALSELDVRLSAVDHVSGHLEEEYQKNQELLERLIQLRMESEPPKCAQTPEHRRSMNFRLNVNDSNGKSVKHPQDHLVARDKGHGIRKSKNNLPGMDARFPPPAESRYNKVGKAIHDRPHASPGTGRSRSARSLRRRTSSLDQRTNSVNLADAVLGPNVNRTPSAGAGLFEPLLCARQPSMGSLLRKREQSRIERNCALRTKRCADAVKYATEVLDQNEIFKLQTLHSFDLETKHRKHSNRGSATAGQSRQTTNRLSRKKVLFPKPTPNTPLSSHNRGTSNTLRRGRLARRRPGGRFPKHHERKTQPLILDLTSVSGVTCGDEEQTTILSEWSLESGVKRLLYEKEEKISGHVICVNEQYTEGCTEDISKMLEETEETCVKLPEDVEQLTDAGAAQSTSYVDWEEVDELLKGH